MRTSVFAATEEKIISVYQAEISMNSWLVGGIPSDPDLMEAWIRKNMGVTREDEIQRLTAQTLIEIGALSPDDVSDPNVSYQSVEEAARVVAKKTSMTVFKRDTDGLYAESRTLMACLREAVSILFPYQAPDNIGKWGITKKAANGLFRETVSITPERIPILVPGPEGTLVRAVEPTGNFLFTGHVQNRSMLGRHEYIEDAVLRFNVNVVLDAVPEAAWEYIWVQAQQGGYGAMRSQQYGKFAVTAWEKIRQASGISAAEILASNALNKAITEVAEQRKASRQKQLVTPAGV